VRERTVRVSSESRVRVAPSAAHPANLINVIANEISLERRFSGEHEGHETCSPLRLVVRTVCWEELQ
jgi:hypothetical protein